MLDLLVLGCGPVGAMAGNLAGQAGLTTAVLDRAPGVFDLPRAIHFDAHIMRILQQVGLAREVLPAVRVWKRSTFYGADAEPIRVHDWPSDKPYGWDAHYLFYQPTLEAVLRDGLTRLDDVDVQLGVEAVAVDQLDDHVTVTIRDPGGELSTLSARYLIGADGASSFVRSSAGIRLLDGDFDEPWLVVDLSCAREIGRPDESEMFCDPARPATRVPGPGRHHRWEFMLLPGETPEEMQRPERIRDLLAPWVGMDEVEIIRASVYRFHSLIAETWRRGRVFLAGDAAHQTPPFLGQGLCHGLRDVQNLVGKLAAARAGGPSQQLLDSYEAERRPHVERIIGMAVAAGLEICVLDPAEAKKRDRRLRQAAQSGDLPRTTFQGMPPLTGGLFDGTPGAGEQFPQPSVLDGQGWLGMFDDVVPPQVVVVARGAAVPEIRAVTDQLGIPLVAVGDPGTGHLFTVDQSVSEWFDRHGARFALVRPDRYVHGATDSADAAKAMIRVVCEYFPGSR
ncbi:bifunctional 3-(3-hydroxy-phenyl)propionate/3-hydroxycinnamic acid hydroxylase [Amycolatopsis sp. NBC_01488]|uniref:bifunctional 3-(3-hydroxy-phenyl)propionate/3-hydroxycinnamic acid hydroxylase MhpA n=1 Tax=Amycolatopsis sp. NBC_01488 TaxID=2903563 RepID=UPI002E2926A8|nr:bifunctional 3-(3-hydroxy-phenyl)propionate/3-hydroxycinnamic acid hydroxylase [Amycolatopsis sp. NBC_01488]